MPHTSDLVPLVDGEVVVARDGDDGGHGHSGVGVGGDVRHRRVGQELHYHADVVLDCGEHHRRLRNNNVTRSTLQGLPVQQRIDYKVAVLTFKIRSISWAICKSAPRSRQIATPAPHHSVFLQARCPSCRPTSSVKALKASLRQSIKPKITPAFA